MIRILKWAFIGFAVAFLLRFGVRQVFGAGYLFADPPGYEAANTYIIITPPYSSPYGGYPYNGYYGGYPYRGYGGYRGGYGHPGYGGYYGGYGGYYGGYHGHHGHCR